ncbi:caspase family protein [Ancylobacter terrae]|uniref:caspase family protein n=1 Tax=Ancylobacter sp. sgz301288 TaxID=3342077 RepID=UPI00385D9B15
MRVPPPFRHRLLAILALALAPWAAPGAAQARNLALLVGVAAYDEPSIRPLEGPRNDVVALWRYLVRHDFAPADIEVLAEGLPAAADTPTPEAAPTRAAILDGLDRLAARAGAGDFVLFHYSGHGTTQPQTQAEGEGAGGEDAEIEAGGRDQVLLPKDAGRYDAAARGIRNAIVDNELGAALDRIRARGATVWVVVDACHAGSVTRSADATRSVDPLALGVPAAGATPPATPPAPHPPERAGTFDPATLRGGAAVAAGGAGPLIAFFAVDSWTLAIERAYPVPSTGAASGSAGEEQAKFGVFTWHLLRALEAGQARSFRDLARRVSLDIAAGSRLAQAPLPVFEGDLDRGLFGAAGEGAARFPARLENGEVVIEAGALQGFDAGAEVALFDGPLGGAARLGTARLDTATAADSRAPLADPPAPGEGGLWAQVERPGVAFRFRVAGVADAPVDGRIRAALAPGEGGPAIGVEPVAPGAPADLRLDVAEGRLWLAPEGAPLVRDPQAYGRSFSLPLDLPPGDFDRQLRAAVFAYARAANLVRVASLAEMEAGAGAGDIEIALERIRETDPARLADPRRACAAAARPSAPLPVDSGAAAALAHCDMVRLTIANRSDRDIDLGVFFLDPLGGIDVPVKDWRQNGCIATLPAKASGPLVLRTTLRSWGKNGPGQIGLHRILVFALPRTGGIPPSLCHLLQRDAATAAAGAAALRNAGGKGGLIDLLSRAALVDPALRAANPFEEETEAAGGPVVRQFTLDLLPPGGGR